MSEVARQEIKRSREFWYQDGNIVLQCENTQFRVHQSLLARHFPIHADASAFALSNESEYVEGCPVARVVGDKPEDWENVLMAVYNPFTSYSSTTEYPIPVVVSTLRLAHKYQSDHLRDMAMACLKTKIPSDLDGMSALLTFIINRFRAPAFTEYLCDILNVAVELGMQSIALPTCLLCIGYMEMDQILTEQTRGDGSVLSLSPAASKMVLSGWHSLTSLAIEHTINPPMSLHPYSERCQEQYIDDDDISPTETDVFNECNAEFRTYALASRTLTVAKNPALAFALGPIHLCGVCATPIDDDYYKGRAELWDKLPTLFGFPSWDELNDFDL